MDSSLLFGHTADWWNGLMSVSLVGAALVAGFVAAATTGAVVASKREALAAKVELDRYKTDAGIRIAEANSAGVKAGRAAGNATLKAAEANERAAKLEKEAAEARLALAKLQSKLAWRVLSKEQADALAEARRGHPMHIEFT